LTNDGFINNEDDDLDFELSKYELIINGKTQSNDMLIKYRNVYKKHYGKEIESKFRIKK